MTSSYVFGKNSVKLLLQSNPARVFKIFLAEGLKSDKRLDAILELARQHKKPVVTSPRQKLDQMIADIPDSSHQGVIASVAPKELLSLNQLIEQCQPALQNNQNPVLLMLDGITDPRNFGAILRTCDAVGVSGVIITKHDSAGFGPVVAKTASGAEETVSIAVVSNLNNAIDQLKKSNFWIVGAAGEEDKAIDYFKQDFKMPVVLVLGSEGEGLKSLVRKNCDLLVKIPMHGSVESLNVSVAAGVLLYAIRQPR